MGRVRSLDLMSRRVSKKGKEHFVKLKGRILSNNKTNGNGYRVCCLCKNSKNKNKYVHRLVAEAFLLKTVGREIVNHKDSDITNNCHTNLEWCTSKENYHHAKDKGRYPCKKGKYWGKYGQECSFSKLSNDDTIKIYIMSHSGELSQREIGELFNISQGMVSDIKLRKKLKTITRGVSL